MKRRIDTLMALCTAVMLVLAAGCEKGSGNRRDPDNGGGTNPPAKKYIENPSWTLTYVGREVQVSKEGTYIVDVITMDSGDDRDYYVDVVDIETFRDTYGSKIERLLDGIGIDEAWVENGGGDCTFDMLDTAPGKWIAVAVEVSGGKKGSYYTMLSFTTEEVTYKKDDSWKMSYAPRVKAANGDIVDAITVEPNGCDYSYYVEIAYPEYLDANYDGDPVAFFNDRLDRIAEDLAEDEDFSGVVYNGKTTVQFDRLRSGEWTAYAFGVDNRGYLTGNWSELDFNAPEEEATPEFNKWLGRWRIGGAGGGFNYDTKEPVSGYYYYDIKVSSSENNYFYVINDWETGISANDIANSNCGDYQFETAFIPQGGKMQFLNTYLGSVEYDDMGLVDVMLLGIVEDGNGDEYYILDENIPVATAALDADGSKASVTPEKVEAALSGGTVKTLTFKAMQYVDVPYDEDEDLLPYNYGVPYLPMTMEKLHDASSAAARTAVSRPLPAGRRVTTEENAVSKAVSPVSSHRLSKGSAARRTVDATSRKAPHKVSATKSGIAKTARKTAGANSRSRR